jgi:hypothetical protein
VRLRRNTARRKIAELGFNPSFAKAFLGKDRFVIPYPISLYGFTTNLLATLAIFTKARSLTGRYFAQDVPTER